MNYLNDLPLEINSIILSWLSVHDINTFFKIITKRINVKYLLLNSLEMIDNTLPIYYTKLCRGSTKYNIILYKVLVNNYIFINNIKKSCLYSHYYEMRDKFDVVDAYAKMDKFRGTRYPKTKLYKVYLSRYVNILFRILFYVTFPKTYELIKDKVKTKNWIKLYPNVILIFMCEKEQLIGRNLDDKYLSEFVNKIRDKLTNYPELFIE